MGVNQKLQNIFFFSYIERLFIFNKNFIITFSVLIAILKSTVFYLKIWLHWLSDRDSFLLILSLNCGHRSAGSAVVPLLSFDPSPGDAGHIRAQVPSEAEEGSVFSIKVSLMSMDSVRKTFSQ